MPLQAENAAHGFKLTAEVVPPATTPSGSGGSGQVSGGINDIRE